MSANRRKNEYKLGGWVQEVEHNIFEQHFSEKTQFNQLSGTNGLIMEMQRGSTNNHSSQIFFVFIARVYWWDWINSTSTKIVGFKWDCHLAAPALIDRSMTNYWAGVSWKGNTIIPRCQTDKEKKDIKTVRGQCLSFATFPTHLVSHWSLPLKPICS
jgi:hypothetical protein